VTSVFSSSYCEARAGFLAAARGAKADLFHYPHPSQRGAEGEELSMDVAWLGDGDQEKVLVVSSGTHGVEGFCGSAVQTALLQDAELRDAMRTRRIALMLVHAVNPYGFSHLHRTNEDNIDLNRNAIDFGRPPPSNPGYAALHALLVPSTWPPSARNEAELGARVAALGMRAFQAAVAGGQYERPEGLFFGGSGTSWSVRTLAEALRRHAGHARHLGWIDVHTGLGPYGFGEKIHVGSADPQALTRARRWWGADVTPAGGDESVSPDVSGPVATMGERCCAGTVTTIGLEFGTVPMPTVLYALRADAWRRGHPEARDEQRRQIGRELRDAFLCDREDWKGMVLGQSRVAVVQAARGLEQEGETA
jgi:hypothetical protein